MFMAEEKICARKEGERQKLMFLSKSKFIMAKAVGTSYVLFYSCGNELGDHQPPVSRPASN